MQGYFLYFYKIGAFIALKQKCIYQKLIRKIIIGLFLTISSHVFGITFGDLSSLQKQIHALLFQITRQETTDDKNYFAVALEIVTENNHTTPGKTYVFLLKNIGGRISFISEGTDDVRKDRERVHDKLYGNPCKGPDGRSCKKVKGAEECGCRGDKAQACYCYRKGFFDSEFACIAFLENNKEYIAKFINEQIKEDKVTKISLHGFTTRDTCSACFQHLVSYCENANREFRDEKDFKIEYKEITPENRESISENKRTFWKSLKDTLGGKVRNLSVPVDFYISSRIYFSGSRLLVEPMENEEKSKNNPMKMLVLRKEFDKEYPEDGCKFSNFIKNRTEDLDEKFQRYFEEQGQRFKESEQYLGNTKQYLEKITQCMSYCNKESFVVYINTQKIR